MTVSAGGSFASIRELVERCRLRNVSAIEAVVERVQRREYAIILGPRFSEKTFLLEDVATELHNREIVPLLVDLEKVQKSGTSSFIATLASAIAAAGLSSITGNMPTTERDLQHLLQGIPDTLQCNAALLFDHLETLPVDTIGALLRVLRAMLMETHVRAPEYSICAVATSTLAVADITLGPTSPFNIASPIFVDDLGRDESGSLVDRFADQLQIRVPPKFHDAIYAKTSGDRYATAQISHFCAEQAKNEARGEVTLEDLDRATEWFLKNADDYQPLRETRRSLEHDPGNLLVLAAILDRGAVPSREVPIAREPALRLTGAVRTEETPEGTMYRPRSELYRQYLSRYYHAPRISRVFFVAGRFEEAVDYLLAQSNLKTDRRTRDAFLDSIIGSIFAARSVGTAIGALADHIKAVFNVSSVAVYLVRPDRAALTRIGTLGTSQALEAIPLDADSLEKTAYFSEHYAMDVEQSRLAVPLRDGMSDPSGVVVVTGPHAPRDQEFAELVAFIRRAGKALGLVADRGRRVDQLQHLVTVLREVARFVDLRQVLKTTVEEGIKAIDGAQRGVLLLYDDAEKKLRVREHRGGYRPGFAEEMIVDPEGGSYSADVFKTGKPALIEDAEHDDRVKMRNDVDIAKQRSALCVQLAAWGRRIGVFCVDNVTTVQAFRGDAADLLSAFATQAAIAIQNAVIYRELYDLSLAINGTNLRASDIFHRVVRSIVRVTGAEAANIVLLRNADDPARALAQPVEVYAYGMGDDFEKSFLPRPNGVTSYVLKNREYVIVPSPNHDLTINPLSLDQQVAATIALPLLITDVMLGVLYVNFTGLHVFSPEEIDILAFYANECAVAIERVRQEEKRIHASVSWMGLDLSEMGHDITQGLSRVNANLFMLSSRAEPRSEIANLVHEAQGAVDAIASVLDRAFSAGREHFENFDLIAVIRTETQRWCGTHALISLDRNGLEGKCAVVSADPRRLEKVIKTLMQNAVRAAKMSERRSIRIAAAVHARTVEVTFANSGERISSETADRLFRSPVESAQGGQGVGLLIARAIVFGYAGDLALTSSDEAETVFTLTLPLAQKTFGEPC